MPSLKELAARLLGVSAYQPPPTTHYVNDEVIEEARKRSGGNLAPLPATRLRWYMQDLETAQRAADMGDLMMAAQLYRAMRRDGNISGLLETRASGLIRLPRTFSGPEALVTAMKAMNGSRSVFDETFPPSECSLMVQDGIMLGAALGELVPVPGRAHPVMIRQEPEFLLYRWNENQWYFRSVGGLVPITPGDGRWILHIPMGRMSPWHFGKWIACGDAFISKSHAKNYRGNFGGKLANPARVLTAPLGANEPERYGMLSALARWGINTVFELPVGWDAKLLESNAAGSSVRVWRDDEASANDDVRMALAGQIVTSDGGSGFINGDLFKSIRADLIQTDGDSWAHTLNTQGLPALAYALQGQNGLDALASVAFETKQPADAVRETTVLQGVAIAVKMLNEALGPLGLQVSAEEIRARFDLPVVTAAAQSSGDLADVTSAIALAKANGVRPKPEAILAILSALGVEAEEVPAEKTVVALDLAPTDVAKVVTVDEARRSRGLPGKGDERYISELDKPTEPSDNEPPADDTPAD